MKKLFVIVALFFMPLTSMAIATPASNFNSFSIPNLGDDIADYTSELNSLFPESQISIAASAMGSQIDQSEVLEELQVLEKLLSGELEDDGGWGLIHLACNIPACCGGPCN